jgi:hypothetical protein
LCLLYKDGSMERKVTWRTKGLNSTNGSKGKNPGQTKKKILVRAIFSAPVQTAPGAHPASYTMGTGSFLGVKRPGCRVEHQPHLAPRLKKEQCTCPCAFMAS